MKKIFLFAFLAQPFLAFAQFGAQPPFTVQIEPVTQTVPGIHSFAFAQSGTKWLIIGGRINGLHGFSSNDSFDPTYANNDIYVIDTATWNFWSASLNPLPDTIADPLRSTNMQYYQDSAYLYITGGFGWDSILGQFVTFPTLTAVHIDNMINAVQTASPLTPHIRQISDTLFKVCGAEMTKLGNYYYLLFGHDFGGRYTDPPSPLFTQVYTNQIRRFMLTDNGTTITILNVSAQTDTANFHRRDLNVCPKVKPDGSFAIGVYGGVFQYTQNLPWRNPITVDASTTTVNTSYQQIMSQYTCANFVVVDTATNDLFTTFLGGISLYDYIPSTSTALLDTLVPFIHDITTFTERQSGVCEEAVLPVQFSVRLGSNAKFVLNENVAHFSNGVIKFRDLLPAQRTLVGYMYGGIRSSVDNYATAQSMPNDTVYRIYITPDLTFSVAGSTPEIFSFGVFPNPALASANVDIKLSAAKSIRLSVFDVTGKEAVVLFTGKKEKGNHAFILDTKNLAAGIYEVTLRTDNDFRSVKLSVVK